MEPSTLRVLIREKLADGRLRQNSIPRVWGGPSNSETCDACGEVVAKHQFVMEAVSTDLSKRALQFHVGCFHLWDAERTPPERETVSLARLFTERDRADPRRHRDRHDRRAGAA